MGEINLFNIIPDDFFKPLTSKYKINYMDCLCLYIIHNFVDTLLPGLLLKGTEKKLILLE